MVERREQFRLPLETRQPIRILCERVRQDFDRNVALQPGITSAIHFPHPASTNGRENLVGANASASDKGHGGFR
jgi:hypothetical protein